MKTDTDAMTELFGEPISVYTREQAIADGELVDVTEWASADKGFHGGFTCPVVMTRALWAVVDIDSRPKKTGFQDTRGRAHDVLWMASLAVRTYRRRHPEAETMDCMFDLLLTNGRSKKARLRIVFLPSEGFTIGFPQDF